MTALLAWFFSAQFTLRANFPEPTEARRSEFTSQTEQSNTTHSQEFWNRLAYPTDQYSVLLSICYHRGKHLGMHWKWQPSSFQLTRTVFKQPNSTVSFVSNTHSLWVRQQQRTLNRRMYQSNPSGEDFPQSASLSRRIAPMLPKWPHYHPLGSKLFTTTLHPISPKSVSVVFPTIYTDSQLFQPVPLCQQVTLWFHLKAHHSVKLLGPVCTKDPRWSV